MSDFFYIDQNTRANVEKTSQVNVSKGLYNNYQIGRSCLFNSSSSQYLSRTPASAGNRKTWTWSGWVKKSVFGSGTGLTLFAYGPATTTYARLVFEDDTIIFDDRPPSGLVGRLTTTPVYRDPSAWYHIVVVFNTTVATASDRMQLYVNGSRVTNLSTATYPSQDVDGLINQAVAHNIGRSEYFGQYFSGYLAEINFIDGQALGPENFGYFDNQRDFVWKPKKYSGNYGVNGFYLNFSDSSILGRDFSGNNNNWTTNGGMTGSGSTSNIVNDSPTDNYPTFNPLVPNATGFSNGNLTYTGTGVGRGITFQSLPQSGGRWYFEATVTASGGSTERSSIILANDSGYIEYINTGSKRISGVTSSYGSTYTTGDVIGIAIDSTTSTATFYKNNVSQGGIAFISTNGCYISLYAFNSSDVWSLNFGQRAFISTPPTGFLRLSTANLPVPSIKKPNHYMNVQLWTGTGSGTTRAITGVGFQPDFVWAKARTGVYSHVLYDVIRGGGANSAMNSNSNGAEGGNNDDQYGYLSSFDSDGFTSTAGTQGAANNLYFNESGKTYVAWNWKANGAGSSNNSGTITSTVSVNALAGFSIVSYTGTGVNATVGHGLGVAPSMVIVKNRNPSVNQGEWTVYHKNANVAPASGGVFLNLTNAFQASSTYWNNTTPTSSVFSIGTNGVVNENTKGIIAYCFAEVEGYSKFGSYAGNNSTDGPFVYCGFRPRWILIKNITIGTVNQSDWFVCDTARNPINTTTNGLLANLQGIEYTATNEAIDVVSNGFKLRGVSNYTNNTSTSFIFAAFAETPFKYSLAR